MVTEILTKPVLVSLHLYPRKSMNPSSPIYGLNNKADWNLLHWVVASLGKRKISIQTPVKSRADWAL